MTKVQSFGIDKATALQPLQIWPRYMGVPCGVCVERRLKEGRHCMKILDNISGIKHCAGVRSARWSEWNTFNSSHFLSSFFKTSCSRNISRSSCAISSPTLSTTWWIWTVSLSDGTQFVWSIPGTGEIGADCTFASTWPQFVCQMKSLGDVGIPCEL